MLHLSSVHNDGTCGCAGTQVALPIRCPSQHSVLLAAEVLLHDVLQVFLKQCRQTLTYRVLSS